MHPASFLLAEFPMHVNRVATNYQINLSMHPPSCTLHISLLLLPHMHVAY